uniref:Endo-1,4-beta-xylanase n=1 Tax=uncultured bacterium contig00142 TaxID=1181584 RepID=A0A806JZS4_9BACT|nr:xylanase [uncultured bacterium contig00142]
MKKNLAILTALLLVFTIFNCGPEPTPESVNQTVFYDGPDPATFTTALTGGTTYTGNSSGPKPLASSPYYYELWSEKNSSTTKLTWYGTSQGGGAAFGAEWDNNDNFLGRVGYYWNEGKPYTYYKNLFCAYNFTVGGTYGGWSYIGIYGWSRNTTISKTTDLIEYYIIDSSHPGYTFPFVPYGGTLKGSFIVDGATYKVYTAPRPASAGAIVSGHPGFTQYFSVRQSRRSAGVISITEHFKQWEKMGMELGSNMYEARFKVEVGGGTGWFNSTFIMFQQKP